MPLCYLITVLIIGDPDVIWTRTVLRSRILTIRGATALCDVHTATMSERLQPVLIRRTTAKRRITNMASRFSRVLTDDNACQTVHDLRIDMRNTLETFRAVDDQLRPLLEAAEANALPTDKPIMSRTVSEDIINSAEYITSAEDMLFEACRYIESHSPQTSNISTTVASNVSEPRGQKVSFRPMTHDDCGLWFAQLEDVFFFFGYYVTNQQVCGSHHVVDRRGGLRGAWPDTAGTRASCGRIRHGKEAFRPTVRSHHSPAAHTGFRHWRCRCQRKAVAVDGPVQARKWRLDMRRCRAVGSSPALAEISANHPRDAVTSTSYGGVIAQSGRTLRYPPQQSLVLVRHQLN